MAGWRPPPRGWPRAVDAQRNATAALDAKIAILTGAVETVAKAQAALAETPWRDPAGPPRPASTGGGAETQTEL